MSVTICIVVAIALIFFFGEFLQAVIAALLLATFLWLWSNPVEANKYYNNLTNAQKAEQNKEKTNGIAPRPTQSR